MLDPELCSWCGLAPRRRTGWYQGAECEACSKYRRRYGTGRPEHLIRRHAERIDREQGHRRG